jgi:ATP-dependent DNA helicase RecQ
LRQLKTEVRTTRFDEESWAGVDRGLFESLRELRQEIASARSVPTYIIFSDATLRDMARVRPSSAASLLNVRGVGQHKLADTGPRFLERITTYCHTQNLSLDATTGSRPRQLSGSSRSEMKETAFSLFAQGTSVEQVATATNRALSTTWGYLEEFIAIHRPQRVEQWIDAQTYDTVAAAAQEVGTAYLKPIFEHLEGKVSYGQIRLVVAHLNATRSDPAPKSVSVQPSAVSFQQK